MPGPWDVSGHVSFQSGFQSGLIDNGENFYHIINLQNIFMPSLVACTQGDQRHGKNFTIPGDPDRDRGYGWFR